MKEVMEFIKDAGVYFLSTIDEDKPRVRPFGTLEIFEDHLYIQTGKNKDVFKQIEKNNNVELSAYKDGRWIRVSGKLIIDDRYEAKKYMLDQNPSLRSMYDENDNNTIVLYFENGKAIISSFTEEPKVIEF